MPDGQAAPQRIEIQYPSPAVDGGRFPAKRCAGDTVRVEADIFRDGHELLQAVVRYRGPGQPLRREAEMHRTDAHLEGVRWAGEFSVPQTGRWEYAIEAWSDVFETWRDELTRKLAAGQPEVAGELAEGVLLLQAVARSAKDKSNRATVERALSVLENPDTAEAAKHEAALDEELRHADSE